MLSEAYHQRDLAVSTLEVIMEAVNKKDPHLPPINDIFYLTIEDLKESLKVIDEYYQDELEKLNQSKSSEWLENLRKKDLPAEQT